jgi:SAM-dependent methyltransferase
MATSPATDWNVYYKKGPGLARFTRRVTEGALVDCLRRYSDPHPVLVELGGAASCVFDAVRREIAPREYHVVDNNELGLEILAQRAGEQAILHKASVLELELPLQADTVFSLGLIEHFDVERTRKAVLAHLHLLRPNGIAVISFPTPTFLYRATRGVAELAGKWIFHDERPLWTEEVAAAVADHGDILHERLLWSIFLTQTMLVIRKRPEGILESDSEVPHHSKGLR